MQHCIAIGLGGALPGIRAVLVHTVLLRHSALCSTLTYTHTHTHTHTSDAAVEVQMTPKQQNEHSTAPNTTSVNKQFAVGI